MAAIMFQAEGTGRSLDVPEDSSQQLHNCVWGVWDVWGRRGQHLLVSHSIIFSSALHHLVWALLSILLPSSGGLFIPQPSVYFSLRSCIHGGHLTPTYIL